MLKHNLKNRPKLPTKPDYGDCEEECIPMEEWFLEFEKELREILENGRLCNECPILFFCGDADNEDIDCKALQVLKEILGDETP
jgi:hypothetical protein